MPSASEPSVSVLPALGPALGEQHGDGARLSRYSQITWLSKIAVLAVDDQRRDLAERIGAVDLDVVARIGVGGDDLDLVASAPSWPASSSPCGRRATAGWTAASSWRQRLRHDMRDVALARNGAGGTARSATKKPTPDLAIGSSEADGEPAGPQVRRRQMPTPDRSPANLSGPARERDPSAVTRTSLALNAARVASLGKSCVSRAGDLIFNPPESNSVRAALARERTFRRGKDRNFARCVSDETRSCALSRRRPASGSPPAAAAACRDP